MPEEIVVCNTTPLHYLYQVELLDILRALYGDLLVPEAVVAEIERGIEAGVALPDLRRISWIAILQQCGFRLAESTRKDFLNLAGET
ncbi:MAG: hypothetical protein JRJ48_07520 [Deltaproteobacteria bacterium]|nr:hypothetical protein [Deltaproteobacteria bacterium]